MAKSNTLYSRFFCVNPGRSITGTHTGMKEYEDLNRYRYSAGMQFVRVGNQTATSRLWPKHGRDQFIRFTDHLETITGKKLGSC